MDNRKKLKTYMPLLLEKHRIFFKKIHNMESYDDIDKMIDDLDSRSLINAVRLCESTLKKRSEWIVEWRDEQIDKLI